MAAEWEWIAPTGTAVAGVLVGYGTFRKLISASRVNEVQTITESCLRVVDSLRAQIAEAAREREAVAAERARERAELHARLEALELAIRRAHARTCCDDDCESRKTCDPPIGGALEPPANQE